MDDLSAASRTFDSLSSFYRSFSKRSRRPNVPPRVVKYSETAAFSVVSEAAVTHQSVAIEQTESALDHFLELRQRLAEVRRRHESTVRFQAEGGAYGQSQVALEEKRAWERWMTVIEKALLHAEEEIISAVRAWDEMKRPGDTESLESRGVIYKGHLYLALPSERDGQYRLVVANLKSSLNLDKSLAIVDLIS